MSVPRTLPLPKPQGPPQAATVMRWRSPGTKYHRNLGQAKNAVIYKIGYDGTASEDMALYVLRDGEFVLVREWKRGDVVDRDDLREVQA